MKTVTTLDYWRRQGDYRLDGVNDVLARRSDYLPPYRREVVTGIVTRTFGALPEGSIVEVLGLCNGIAICNSHIGLEPEFNSTHLIPADAVLPEIPGECFDYSI